MNNNNHKKIKDLCVWRLFVRCKISINIHKTCFLVIMTRSLSVGTHQTLAFGVTACITTSKTQARFHNLSGKQLIKSQNMSY